MKKTSFLILLILLSLGSYAQTGTPAVTKPTEYELGGLTISGTKTLDVDILKTYTGLVVGQKINIPGEEIGQAIQILWKQGFFQNIEVDITKTLGDKVFLDFVLTERPRLSNFSYKGVKKSDADDINKHIQLIKGKVLTENIKVNATEKIKEYFLDKGFSNIKVETFEKPDTLGKRNQVMLTFVISKGKKVRIEDVFFVGNNNASNGKLKRLMKETKERSKVRPIQPGDGLALRHFSLGKMLKGANQLTLPATMDFLRERFRLNIFSTSRFKPDEFISDKQKIVDYYNTKGYRDAQVTGDTIYKAANGNYIVGVYVNEGPRYYFRHIYWKGNTKHTDKELNDILAIKRGDIYDRSQLDARLNMNQNGADVSSLYMDDGYLFFQVNPSEVGVENDSIDLEIGIYEGPQATINKVIIKGNEKTNEHVIRRELRTIPGQKFSRSDIIRSQREIATLGFFNPEKIGITPIPHPETGTVDIEYTVEEKSSDQIELQAGWGGKRQGVVGTVGVAFNNFSLRNIPKADAWTPLPSGDGQKFSIRGQSTGKYYQSVNASFTEPWLGGNKPNSLSIGSYSSWFNSTGLDGKASQQVIIGGSVGLGTRLKFPDDYFTLTHAINYEHYILKNIPPSYFFLKDGVANNLNLEETFSRNSIDQPLYPRSGSNFTLTVKLTPPYSLFNKIDYSTDDLATKYKWIEYHKWRFNAEWYNKIAGNLVLKTSAKTGFLGFYQSKVGISPFERFLLGGDGLNTFRQYGRDIISMRGYSQEEIMGTAGTNVGASVFNKFTIELRYPISLNPSSTIYAMIFGEGGNVTNKFNQYDPFRLKRSAGIGLRVFLPMFGLLGVDYGIGFDKGISNPKIADLGKFNIILGFEPE